MLGRPHLRISACLLGSRAFPASPFVLPRFWCRVSRHGQARAAPKGRYLRLYTPSFDKRRVILGATAYISITHTSIGYVVGRMQPNRSRLVISCLFDGTTNNQILGCIDKATRADIPSLPYDHNRSRGTGTRSKLHVAEAVAVHGIPNAKKASSAPHQAHPMLQLTNRQPQ